MEKLIIPFFAVFGFFGSLLFDAGEETVARTTTTNKADLQGDS